MATAAEKKKLSGWADQVRVASTWLSGPKRRKLLALANEIDPEVEVAPEDELPPVTDPPSSDADGPE